MKEITVSGQKRTDLGKKASKALRKQGMVPCNIYGEKKDENGKPVALAFASPMSELRKLVYTPHIYVVNLNIDGESHPAILKELQFHPVTDALLHVDFYEVNDEKPITIGVPVKLNGLARLTRGGSAVWHPAARTRPRPCPLSAKIGSRKIVTPARCHSLHRSPSHWA